MIKKYILPTLCVDEIKFCKDGKFFFVKYKEGGYDHILAKFEYDSLLHSIQKQGFDIVNKDGSLYSIEEGC